MIFGPSGAGGGGISAWTTGTVYVVNDVIYYANYIYQCIVAHTAGASFETDIQAGKWTIINKPLVYENLVTVGNNFEDNDVGGWTATGCATVTNGLPVSVGSGGAAFSSSNGGRAKGANTTAPAVTSSGPINGLYSLNLATSGAGTIGDGYISQIYPIPIKYQAKAMVAEVAFKVASGTPVMGGTSADTYAIAIYSPSDNSWLPNAGVFSFTQSSGVGIARTTFQTSSNCTGIQIFIYSPVAPTGSSSLLLDDVSIYKQDVVYGSPVTDWKSFTPTTVAAAWANTSLSGMYRRVGDSAEIIYKLTTTGGAVSGSALSFYMPPGLVLDNSKLLSSGDGMVVGHGGIYQTGVSDLNLVAFVNNNAGNAYFNAVYISSLTGGITAVTPSAPATISNHPDYIWLTVTVPITGWSSSVVMSSDANTNVVGTRAYKAANQTISTNASFQKILFDTTSFDTTGSWASNKFTANTPGLYEVNAYVEIAASNVISNDYILFIYKNGASFSYQYGARPNANVNFGLSAKDTISLLAGDYIEIYFYGAGNNSVNTITMTSGSDKSNVVIKKISGPAQIAASETVAARYYTASALSLGNTNFSFFDLATKDFDTHGMVTGNGSGIVTTTNTGFKAIVPVSGKYYVKFSLLSASGGGWNAGEEWTTFIYKNGTAVASNANLAQTTHSTLMAANVSTVVQLNAGDRIEPVIYQNSGASLNCVNSAVNNYFEIYRIGN